MRVKTQYTDGNVSLTTPVSDYQLPNKKYVDSQLAIHTTDLNLHFTTEEKVKLSGIEPNATICQGNVTTTGAQTLTNKTLMSPVLSGATTFQEEYLNTVTATNVTVDFANGNKQIITLNRNINLTLTAPGIGNYQLIVFQDAVGKRTLTWSNVTMFLGSGTAPPVKTTSYSRTLFTLYYDGTDFYLAGTKVGG